MWRLIEGEGDRFESSSFIGENAQGSSEREAGFGFGVRDKVGLHAPGSLEWNWLALSPTRSILSSVKGRQGQNIPVLNTKIAECAVS